MNSKQATFREMVAGCDPLFRMKQALFRGSIMFLMLILTACATMTPQQSQQQPPSAQNSGTEMMAGEPKEAQLPDTAIGAESEQLRALPVRFQQPTYLIKQMDKAEKVEDIVIPVGADISTTTGAVPLRDIIKRLAALKNMNVSWASDVDQYIMIDVDIRADEDFFKAIDNILRQVDYFHEMQGNTIVVKYKEEKKFHLAMPPRLASIESSNAGGNSKISSLSASTDINRWNVVRDNLDQILEIWSEPPATSASGVAVSTSGGAGETTATTEEGATGPAVSPIFRPIKPRGKGYYTIDETIGLITVTAPRPLIEKIDNYIENLKSELYRQVSIEAKIVEVSLDDSSKTGLDWSDLLRDNPVRVSLFDGTGNIVPENNYKAISAVNITEKTLPVGSFDLILNAMAKVGKTKVLSNPKVSVMNGQPAVIYVGDNITYIEKVTVTINEGVSQTNVTTAQATSGIRLEVYPTIISEDEIILSLTPLVSDLAELRQETFGDNTVGLPRTTEKTMNSIIRVRSGEMLVVGGLIDREDTTTDDKVQLLGDLPVISNLFKTTEKSKTTRELVVLLRPRIL